MWGGLKRAWQTVVDLRYALVNLTKAAEALALACAALAGELSKHNVITAQHVAALQAQNLLIQVLTSDDEEEDDPAGRLRAAPVKQRKPF